MRFRRNSRIVASLAAIALTAGLAACSSSSNSGSGSGSGAPIKVGVILPENTSIFNTPYQVAAIAAAIQQLNASGGVSGHKLVLDYCNNQNDPTATAACGRQMASDHVAVVADSIDILGPTLVEQLTAEGIPMVNEPLYPGEFDGPDVFPVSDVNQLLLPAMVAEAKKLGLTKVYGFVSNLDTSQFTTPIQLAAQKAGVTDVGYETYPPNVTDYAPLAQKVISSGADVVLCPVGTNFILPFMQALRQAGSKITIMSVPNIGTAQIKQYQSVDNGLIFVGSEVPITPATEKTVPALATMAQAMNAEVKLGDSAADLGTANPFAVTRDWAVMHALAGLMGTIKGSITASSVTKALDSAHNLSMMGIMPPWTPSQTITAPGLGMTKLAENSAYIAEVQNGQLSLLTPRALATKPYL